MKKKSADKPNQPVERLAPLRLFYWIDDLTNTEHFGRTKLFEELRSGRLNAKRWGDRPFVSLWDLATWYEGLPDYAHDSKQTASKTESDK